jgi:hypothetical protein
MNQDTGWFFLSSGMEVTEEEVTTGASLLCPSAYRLYSNDICCRKLFPQQ